MGGGGGRRFRFGFGFGCLFFAGGWKVPLWVRVPVRVGLSVLFYGGGGGRRFRFGFGFGCLFFAGGLGGSALG